MGMNKLPNKLTKLRKHYNYSQDQVAKVLGIDVIDYMALENGRSVCNFEQCKKLASFYRIKVIELFSNSSSVGLHNVKGPSGNDEYYFLPDKTLLEKVKKYYKVHPIRSISIVTSVILVLILGIYGLTYKQYVSIELINNNRLSMNEREVYYIDGSPYVYKTNKTSGEEIAYTADQDLVKVVSGKDFFAVLKKDGTVVSFGLNEDDTKKVNSFKRIVDIAAGDKHLVALNDKGRVYAVGDNEYGQCDVYDYKNVSKVYCFKNATVLTSDDGKLNYCGTLLGSSQLKNYKDPLDIASSDNYLMILNNDKTTNTISNQGNILETNKWRNIIDIACGDDFLVGLRSDGVLLVISDNSDFVSNASSWTNIITITSIDNYLIAYDGNKIYGTGVNDNFDFEQEYFKGSALSSVKNVKISIGNNISVSFDSVDNASGYEVSLTLEDGTLINKYRVTSNATINFPKDGLHLESNYNINITTLGDGKNHLDSETLTVPFTYQTDEGEDSFVDLEFDYTKMTPEELENYLKSVGVGSITPIEISCSEGDSMIRAVNGVSSGQRYARSELEGATVSYNYCKIGTNDE